MITEFKDMIGRTFTTVTGEVGSDLMLFSAADGSWFRFYHSPDCCESVAIEDVVGDLADLVGSPIIEATEVASDGPVLEDQESYTWTFYRFSTVKGTVTVRWLGTSNGYYSERVSFDMRVVL